MDKGEIGNPQDFKMSHLDFVKEWRVRDDTELYSVITKYVLNGSPGHFLHYGS